MSSSEAKVKRSVTVSAPGKILLAGGYLVLEAPNPGLVVGVDRRFYTTVEQIERIQPDDEILPMTVNSPQFHQTWKYAWNYSTCRLTADASNTSQNPFVEKTLSVSLLYLLHSNRLSDTALVITIQADNDFYSLVPHLQERSLDRTLASVQQLPDGLPAATSGADGSILKTGLGSSAAMVTSLVGALCQTLLDDDPSTVDFQYQLAQLCHCHAQGKVGSGFDVAAAVYGSHVYRRFSKQLVDGVLAQLDEVSSSAEASLQPLYEPLHQVLQQTWTGGVEQPLSLPSILQVLLADVSGGSSSPSMARTVFQWKKAQQQESGAVPHWDDLARINRNIVALLQQLSTVPVSDADRVALANCPLVEEWPSTSLEAGPLLLQLQTAFAESRRELKAMGVAAGVPVEPDEQSALADATSELPGVVTALVPGAGGYDALACVYINDDSVRERISQLWAAWPSAQVCPLNIHAVNYGDGMRVEER